MAATYPEMFAAGIAYSGVAAGCFLSQSGGTAAWNNSCANGQARGTPEVWAKVSKSQLLLTYHKLTPPQDGHRHVPRL